MLSSLFIDIFCAVNRIIVCMYIVFVLIQFYVNTFLLIYTEKINNCYSEFRFYSRKKAGMVYRLRNVVGIYLPVVHFLIVRISNSYSGPTGCCFAIILARLTYKFTPEINKLYSFIYSFIIYFRFLYIWKLVQATL